MRGLDPKIVFDPLNKSQTPDGERFRSAVLARSTAVFHRLLDPFAVCSLKISRIRKATHMSQFEFFLAFSNVAPD